jgi:hypothetical protein
MSQPALKAKYYLTDLERLNRIVDSAREVVLQPDKFKLAELEQRIKEAEKCGRTSD